MLEEAVDPRIRRTRALLQNSLAELLRTKSFEKISVADIADAATLNRATFYDHYTDKYALLDGLVSRRFDELLARRGVAFDGTCEGALSATVLAVCHYLESLPWIESVERIATQSHLEAAIVTVVRRALLAGMVRERRDGAASPEMLATAVSWAMYGACKEWLREPERAASRDIAGTIAGLMTPLLERAVWVSDRDIR